MKKCPCGSQKPYAMCCAPYITGAQLPPAPEALMRSRYTAYTQANVTYIQNTMRGKAAVGFDPQAAQSWATKAKWQRLKVLAASPVAPDTVSGSVEFIAYYLWHGQKQQLHELSFFLKEEGRWWYVDGVSKK